MVLLRKSSVLRFYKKHTESRMGNPLRRYLYHYLIGIGGVGTLSYFILMYHLAGWEAKKHGNASGYFVCSPSMMDFFWMLPINRISDFFGSLSDVGTLSPRVHHALISALVWLFQIDLSESRQGSFDSLQDFYTREWKPECRPINRAAVGISPCDGVIVELLENIPGDVMFRVKGYTYGVRSLFRSYPPSVPEGYKRVAVVIRMRLADFHHVIAPTRFYCEESVYVPGALLPTTVAGYHWLPGVLALNERIVVRGKCADNVGNVFLAMVGSTLTGKMKLSFDERVRTNFLDPPDYAVFSKYRVKPLLAVGSPVGVFLWGSSLVLMMDVPNSAKFQPKRGDIVKAGEALWI
ncbi:unnamed protein product [Phytomonas sp. EM1]|nr:unnamed protein product [Phytomonas sp. EM1]|eukprot:CCW61358.1 unnamed protein product [Phytomonas sp. isolate EM1]